MRKFDLNKKPSLENLPEEVPAKQEMLEVLEPVVVRNPQEDESDESDELASGIEELTETTAALESLLDSLESSMSKGGMTTSELSLVKMHSDYLTKRIGLESVVVSNENTTTRLAQTQLALESIGEKVKEAGKAIVEFLLKIYDAIIASISKVRHWITNHSTKIVEKLSKMLPETTDKKIEIDVSAFYIDGKLSKKLFDDLDKSSKVVNGIGDRELISIESTIEKLNSQSAQLTSDDIITHREGLFGIAKQAYEELNARLKFKGENGYATAVLSGRHHVGLIYDHGATSLRNVLNYEKDKIIPEMKTVTLRSLGITAEDAKGFEICIKDLNDLLNYYEEQSYDRRERAWLKHYKAAAERKLDVANVIGGAATLMYHILGVNNAVFDNVIYVMKTISSVIDTATSSDKN